MNDSLILKQGLSGIGGLGKILGKGVLEESKKTLKSAGQQISGIESDKNINQAENPDRQKEVAAKTDKTKADQDLIKAMYGKSEDAFAKTPSANPGKTAEEVSKIASLRMQLHKQTYYDPTFNPVKKEPEEKPSEKIEREKEEERWKLQEAQKKKPPPLAVSNERNKIESRVGSG